MDEPRAVRLGEIAAPAQHTTVVQSWLVDTGCGYDLISRPRAQVLKRCIRRAMNPMQFSTAGGPADADE
eukprot:2454350-Alexandrium_andersonii.AAC.1